LIGRTCHVTETGALPMAAHLAFRLGKVGIRQLAHPAGARANDFMKPLRRDGTFVGVEFLADTMAMRT